MKKYFKLKLVVISICIFAFLSFPVLAENLTGLYITADIGYSKVETNFSSAVDVDDTGTAYSFGIGYSFNDYIAIEAGWLDVGQASASTSASSSGTLYGKSYTITGAATVEYEADGFYLGPIVSVPLDKFKAYAKAGVYFWEMDASLFATGTLIYDGIAYAANVKADASESGEDLYFGLGASYDFTDQVAVRTDWTRYKVSDHDIDIFAVGIVIKFANPF